MELGTYLDLISFIGEAFQYYRTWQPFTFMFWVGFNYFILIYLFTLLVDYIFKYLIRRKKEHLKI